MEKIDMSHWERAELFEFFSAVSHPFYSVTFRAIPKSSICRFTMRWGIS